MCPSRTDLNVRKELPSWASPPSLLEVRRVSCFYETFLYFNNKASSIYGKLGNNAPVIPSDICSQSAPRPLP